MSETSQIKAGAGMPDIAKPANDDAGEVVAPASESAFLETESPPDAALEELKSEVLSAVRGAITGVMNRHQPALPGPELDFDFSLRETEQIATELPPDIQQALAEAVAAGDAPAEASPTAPRGEDSIDLTAEVEMLVATEPAVQMLGAPAEQELPLSPIIEPLPLSLVPSSSAGVPAIHTVPLPPPRRQWPAWTTAVLLSVTGIAVGAGTATLLIEPNALETLRGRVDDQLRNIFETSPTKVAKSVPDDAGSESAPALSVVSGAVVQTAPASTAPEPAHAVAASTQTAPSAAAKADTTEPAKPKTESLAAMVRVASAGDAAVFAHRLAKPLGAGAAVLAGGRSSRLEALAALPPQVAIAAAPTGGEIKPAPTELPTEATAKTAVTVAAVEPAPAPEVAEVESVPAATPLSALARAQAALGKGDVETARLVLQAESEAGQVEGMLLLARSFDPSYLKAIGLDPAKGKREIAEKLYRAWYDRSVELGLVSASVNIERLLQAMARAKP